MKNIKLKLIFIVTIAILLIFGLKTPENYAK